MHIFVTQVIIYPNQGGFSIMKKIKKSGVFKYSLIAFVTILTILVGLALSYVNSVINDYEKHHYKNHLNEAVELLKSEAQSGELWTKEGVPSMECSPFEGTLIDQKAAFLTKLNGDIKFSPGEAIGNNEYVYYVIHNNPHTADTNIAKIVLRAKGEMVQKLVVIGIQEYELVSYIPLSHTYTMKLPADVALNSDVTITVNGYTLQDEHGTKNEDGSTTFTFAELYNTPTVTVTDAFGNQAKVKLPDSGNGEIEFDHTFYTLTLPESLSVKVDGNDQAGVKQSDGRMLYRIRLAKKAEVILSDKFNNTYKYIGKDVPISFHAFTLRDDYKVKYTTPDHPDGLDVPDNCIEKVEYTEFKNFSELTEGLPGLLKYEIVILKNDVDVNITDQNGQPITLDPEMSSKDIFFGPVLDTVPDDVAKEVNVLKVLEDWSLFMSCDLNFYSLSKHLIKNSYQYNVAWKYNNSIDRTFTSYHSLGNPPFEQESVTNFVWITDNCFAVDIRFVKHMIVLGDRLDDEMNERCYFVKYDDTNDGRSNPQWKLVAMKEIVKDAE